MTVFSGRQVVPVDYEVEVSQRLLEVLLNGDLKSVYECIDDPLIDVNFIGAVSLKTRKSQLVLREESASEVRVEYEEFKTDVTALFLSVHGGNVALVRKLLNVGADVNQKLFRGFATTVAVREGHLQILQILLKAGACQQACEEALVEASSHGLARPAELLMGSDFIRPHVAVHALAVACCRGFVDVVHTLIECGVDANSTDRLLLQSSKPSLHTNVDCTPLVAAVVSRQVSVVSMLLQAGVRTDTQVRLGAWSWDMNTGEEFRVGAGLAEPYTITWCAVEYFEGSGAILEMLVKKNLSANISHHGRTLLHHAILCGNAGAVKVLLNCGANVECPIKTTGKTEFRPIHMAARYGLSTILQSLIDSGCDLNSTTDSGDTALMICAKFKQEDCLRVLAFSGADFGVVNHIGESAATMWSLGFHRAVLDVIKAGKVLKCNDVSVFSPLMFVAQTGDADALKVLIESGKANLDYQDHNGFSAVMVAAMKGHVDAFRVLVYAGADVKLLNKSGENAISLSKLNQKRDLFEKVMLEFALENGNKNAGGFYALHCAARRGDIDAVKLLTSRGFDLNVPDGDGYTPLMLSAREGHVSVCELLISNGANCDITNTRGETALSLARKNVCSDNDTCHVILDELARKLVLSGGRVQKHTKDGKGNPHGKEIKMVKPVVVGGGEGEGGGGVVLKWGKSSRRNIICVEAELGPTVMFRKKRKSKGGDCNEPGLFRVVTNKNRVVHFVCDGGLATAELWVRGIKLVTREGIRGGRM